MKIDNVVCTRPGSALVSGARSPCYSRLKLGYFFCYAPYYIIVVDVAETLISPGCIYAYKTHFVYYNNITLHNAIRVYRVCVVTILSAG